MLLAVTALIAVIVLSSCSPNRNTAATRRYQEFITRYNIHYNGTTHMDETLANMESQYEDNFAQRLYMHPVEAKQDQTAPQPEGNFDRSIEKAQKAIQIRSIKKKPKRKPGRNSDPEYKAWLKRDEYNPFLHNSWMLMADAQYYNGDFAGAASTYFYIIKHFTWLPATVTEAKIRRALCYIAMGWQFDAENILFKIKADDLTSGKLKKLYDFAMADFYIRSGDNTAALPYLQRAAATASGAQKTRLNFLLGQTYAALGDNTRAYTAFGKAGSASSAPYRTKFNARIKQSEVFTGSDITSEVKALRRMTRYDRNKDYLDQVFYAIGNLYLSRGDTVNAIANYVTANEKSTRNGVDKAMNQVRLGGLYFEQGRYDLAQPSYSEAIPQLPKTFPGYDSLKLRSDVLDELAVYAGNVTLQDSLLRLAAMPEDERNAVIDRIIADLKEKERQQAEDEAREEYLADQAAKGDDMKDNTQQFTINSDNSWYFYNVSTRNAGKTEFVRRWGNRKLEDNWRRRNKATFNTDDFNAENDADAADSDSTTVADDSAEPEDPDATKRLSDPHFPEYYLAQIPMTDEAKGTAHEVIQEGLFNMGIILKDKLEDFTASRSQFDRLLNDYPDNIYRLDVYQNLYLMLMRLGRSSEAEHFRQLILSDFAEAPIAQAMRDPQYLEKLRGADNRAEALYQDTYDAYMNGDMPKVHANYARAVADVPTVRIMPKFMFLEALAHVAQGNNEQFNATLRTLLERYPDTDITPIASSWLTGMARGREITAEGTGVRPMVWEMRLSNDSTATAADQELAFTLDPQTSQVLVFMYPTETVNANALLFEVARHNFGSFVVRDFDLEQLTFGPLGLLVVHGFENLRQLDHYRSVMAQSATFHLPAGVRPVAISEDDFRTLLASGRSFEEYFRYRDEQNYIDAQENILQPEEIETLPEAEEATTTREPDTPEAPAPQESPTGQTSQTAPAPEAPQTSRAAQTTPVQPAPAQTAPAQIRPATQPTPAQTAPTAPAPVPADPLIPVGSEGDDPLFDD